MRKRYDYCICGCGNRIEIEQKHDKKQTRLITFNTTIFEEEETKR